METSVTDSFTYEAPLHVAVKEGQADKIRDLMKNGAYINERNREANTALHYAAIYRQPEIIKLLIEAYSADVSVKNKYGDTPLHLAAAQNDFFTINILIQKGADVNCLNLRKFSPLHLAVMSVYECPSSIVRLFKKSNNDNREKAEKLVKEDYIHELILTEYFFENLLLPRNLKL